VPKNDPRVDLLLANRDDIFDDYNEDAFLKAFQEKMIVLERTMLQGTGRILFLMKRKD